MSPLSLTIKKEMPIEGDVGSEATCSICGKGDIL